MPVPVRQFSNDPGRVLAAGASPFAAVPLLAAKPFRAAPSRPAFGAPSLTIPLQDPGLPDPALDARKAAMRRDFRRLRRAAAVDINDFEIRERRRPARLLVALKTLLWRLLKFYTYRLWSQQNQVNGLVITALEGVEEQSAARIAALEKRIVELEKAAGHGRA